MNTRLPNSNSNSTYDLHPSIVMLQLVMVLLPSLRWLPLRR
jgi:hypothetical protein